MLLDKDQDKMKTENREEFSLSMIREKLANSRGQKYWRSLNEIAETEEFSSWVEAEFPNKSTIKQVDRRDFLRFMGASILMASLGGCRSVFMEDQNFVPYVKNPEGLVPGNPLYYASMHSLGGYASGVLVRSDMGRPMKVDGNPVCGKGTNSVTQASILDMYDPDRSKQVLDRGVVSTWDFFFKAVKNYLETSNKSGKGVRILTDFTSSPSFIDLMSKIKKQYPHLEWISYEPVSRDNVLQGSQLAYGQVVETNYHLKHAKVVVSFDADFLESMPGAVKMSGDFMGAKKIRGNKADTNRLYSFECAPSLTGANSDHKWPVVPSQMESLIGYIAGLLGVPGVTGGALPDNVEANAVDALVKDLLKNKGKSALIAGDFLSAECHAIVHGMNDVLQNVGSTVMYNKPVVHEAEKSYESLQKLTHDMSNGMVDVLLIMGTNPVFTAPADLNFSEQLKKVKLKAYLGIHEDETSKCCDWVLPSTHYLETWGDGRSSDGTVCLAQPLISSPLYSSCKSKESVLSRLFLPLGSMKSKFEEPFASEEIVNNFWMEQLGSVSYQKNWKKSLEKGVVSGTSLPTVNVSLNLRLNVRTDLGDQGLEVMFRPDPTIYDGRYANNGWLQELPKPLTKLTWDNTVQVSAKLAEREGLKPEDVVLLELEGRSIEAPIWIVPGQPDNTVLLHLGYGRDMNGLVAEGAGFDAYKLRNSNDVWNAAGIKLSKTGKRYDLASTQMHQNMEGRDLVRTGSVAELSKNPSFEPEGVHHRKPMNLYPDNIFEDKGYQWAMVIDLNQCTGCGSCVTSCQVENNIPVIGKDQTRRGRHMHWIRVDTYFGPRSGEANLDNPSVHFQPITCMHCEKAPCEPVCPVGATNHSHEGLNQMVYNRCIGTRYCANNCPYKVRKFNYLNFGDNVDYPTKNLLNNPRVTVRGRGVMEKCSFCVQRINAARITAKKENRKIRDGEIVVACQESCTTNAIYFGDKNDPNSEVSKMRKEPRNYVLLEELNVRPRTSFLGRVRNPNPEIEAL